jgi:hypothetical protein
MIEAPWTDEQVAALNRHQAKGEYHPFTCGNGSHTLRATADGWVCDECEKLGWPPYRQTWCHEFMTKG